MTSRRKPIAPGASTDEDHQLKLAAARVLTAHGFACELNVVLAATKQAGDLADVTDVDVLGLKYDTTLAPVVVAVTAKNGFAVRPAKEVFALRGVMHYVASAQGLAIFGRKDVDSHLRDLARQLDIQVIGPADMPNWVNSGLRGEPDSGYFTEDRHAVLEHAKSKVEPSLRDFLRAEFWFLRDFRNVQKLIAHLRKGEGTLRRDDAETDAKLLFVALRFSFAFLQLCHRVRSWVGPEFGGEVAAYLFGGSATYRARREVWDRVRNMMANTGALPASFPSLDPAYLGRAAELALRFVTDSIAAADVPLLLQDRMWRALGAPGANALQPQREGRTHILAEELLGFLKDAAGVRRMPSVLGGPSATTNVRGTQQPLAGVERGVAPAPARTEAIRSSESGEGLAGPRELFGPDGTGRS